MLTWRNRSILLYPWMGVQVKSVSGRILTSKNIDDCNSFEHPDIVTPKDFKGAKITKNGLDVELPAKSIVVLEIK